jgi:DNA invertase Pin-like site-specific DNA recombinase
MRVVTYLRVSSVGQIDGDGFDRQEQSCTKFCQAHSLQSETTFKEQGVSGAVDAMERPAFVRMLALIDAASEKGIRLEAIITERMDRLARDLMISEILLSECRKRGIKVFSADQGALIDMASDGGDPTRVLIRQILGALAQWEKSNLVSKLRVARIRKKALTGKCEGCLAYGTRPGEQQILEILGTFADTMTLQGLADVLNEGGLKTRKNTKWTTAAVYSLLKAKNIKK